MKQKDICWADLEPVQGSEQRGKRPVVIISGNAMNENFDLIICCPLTTNIKNFAGCVVVNKNSVNNLKKDSEILTFQIRVISKSRLSKKIGAISSEQLQLIVSGVNDILKY